MARCPRCTPNPRPDCGFAARIRGYPSDPCYAAQSTGTNPAPATYDMDFRCASAGECAGMQRCGKHFHAPTDFYLDADFRFGLGRCRRTGSASHAATSDARQRGVVGPSHTGLGNSPALIFRSNVHGLTFKRRHSSGFVINSMSAAALAPCSRYFCFIVLMHAGPLGPTYFLKKRSTVETEKNLRPCT
jgi:hypothetical protein